VFTGFAISATPAIRARNYPIVK